MNQIISKDNLKDLFNKPYGIDPPTRDVWKLYYDENVTFVDPTQEKYGINSYIESQEKLLQKCDDVFLETHAIVISENIGFIEWTMGLKIQGKEFIYPGTTRLIFGESGKVINHRDYFDFCGPTFGPIPILGKFINWIYSKFVD